MEHTPLGGDPLELEDILDEFAPLPEQEGTSAPAAATSAEEAPPVQEPPAQEVAEEAPTVQEKAPSVQAESPAEVEPSQEEAPAEAEQPVQEAAPQTKGKKPSQDAAPKAKGKPAAPEKTPAAAEQPAPAEAKEKRLPWWKRGAPAQPEVPADPKVIPMPQPDNSVTGRIGRLIEKGDRYAQTMFEGDAPEDPERTRREQLLPGVDWETEPTHAPTLRHRRVLRRPKPDVPPAKLAKTYKKGLAFLHTRVLLSLLWCLPQLYLALAPGLGLPLPAQLIGQPDLLWDLAAVGLCGSALLAADALAWGVMCLLRLRLEGETVALCAVIAALADAVTAPLLGAGEDRAPFCAVVALCLFFALWGRLLKRRALWRSCRAAAGAAEPYLVTLDEKMWNGQDSFTKWAGTVEGYGSQVQEPDGVQRAYHLAAPLILLCAGLFALLASVGRREPTLFFWCLSAGLTAGCGFSSFLTFSLPFSSLSRRLAKVGGALGGWDGMAWVGGKQGVILTDADLFPPGSVTLNGIKLLGDASLETALAYTTTLIRETGSGLAKPFSDMLRAKGGLGRRVSQVIFHEGGVTGVIAGQSVIVGSGAFMELMGVTMPQGIKVKNAVFCAVDGALTAIFALNYTLHPAIAQAVDVLVENGLDPILATRDFLIIPKMLRQRFKLPVDKMEFPSLDRRRELSSKRFAHETSLTAVLCREGLGGYAEAVVGAKRLLSATRWGLGFDLLGAGAGLALAFYLCLARAFASLSPGTMLVFLLLWLVPAALVSGWATRY